MKPRHRSYGRLPQPKIISQDTDRCHVTGRLDVGVSVADLHPVDGGAVLEVAAHVPSNLEYLQVVDVFPGPSEKFSANDNRIHAWRGVTRSYDPIMSASATNMDATDQGYFDRIQERLWTQP